jgi:hypothetical protein
MKIPAIFFFSFRPRLTTIYAGLTGRASTRDDFFCSVFVQNFRTYIQILGKIESPLDAIPEPYVMTGVEDKIIKTILNLLNANGLTAHQAKALLG